MDYSPGSASDGSRILALGSGGFNNHGIPFISFLIGESVLVETPPDIIQSLRRQGISPGSLETVIISHFHGDHIFGLPFLIFNLYRAMPEGRDGKLLLAGPAGLKSRALELMTLAIHERSSYIGWFERNVEVVEIHESAEIPLRGGRFLRFHRVIHQPENYAVSLWSGALRPDFIYISDTKWGPGVARLFSLGAGLVFCDANGGVGDEDVHMSPAQIIGLGIPLTGGRTRVVASHLSDEDPGRYGGLELISPGSVYEI